MKKEKRVEVNQHDMLILISSEVRYALNRDNHLAPSTSADLVKKYLPYFDKEWKDSLVRILISDIESDLRMHDREYKKVWLGLLEYLKGV